MRPLAQGIHIRLLRDEDFEAITEIARANFPDTPRSVEEARDQYHRFDETRYAREHVVVELPGGRVVGQGSFSHVPWSFHPDKYSIYAAVHPEVQRRGIGTALMRHLIGRAEERGATRLKSWAREDYPHAVRFLQHLGFEEHGRTFESRLDVEAADLSRFAVYAERAAQAGAVITTLAEELRRDPECLRAVYQAHAALDIGAPRDDPDLPTPPTFERFVQDTHDPRALLEAFFLAKISDFYVGESVLKRSDADPGLLWQQLTAVLPEYRGHGIATALKVRTVEYARGHGYREIRTFNSSRNGPMLVINGRLGFVRQPAWIDFLRQVRA